MISKAEESGELTRDKIIIEATSGNMGIALAAIGAAKGYRLKLFMPECVSQERQRVLTALGAETVLTPAKEGTDGAIRGVHRLLEEDPDKYYMPNQFDNENNVLAHYDSTGPEIFTQTKGETRCLHGWHGHHGHADGDGQVPQREEAQVSDRWHRTHRRTHHTGAEEHGGVHRAQDLPAKGLG